MVTDIATTVGGGDVLEEVGGGEPSAAAGWNEVTTGVAHTPAAVTAALRSSVLRATTRARSGSDFI
jgi:hypothetical protein